MQQQCVPSFQNSLSGLSGQNIDTFRQRNFSHWVYADLTGYCQSFAGWDFFGFLVREPEILCVAATDNGDFFFSHAQHHFLEQVLAERLEAHPLPTPESVRMALLDLAAGDPWFFFGLPYRHIPADLMLWDKDGACILVAQLASPLQENDPEVNLATALYRWMDSEILIFLSDSIQCPTLGQYCFLKTATSPEMREQRMHALIHNPVVLPRKRLPNFTHL
ncbi:hypothetical protein JKG47_06150 [Acidithiobacillus sp. MC6.1]|nr:hypothetical protein [Acidithiobacillus sp. MC6.1]